MGREARRREQLKREGVALPDQNPVANQLMMKIIDVDKVHEARLRDGIAKVRFSDRTYAIDKNGVLHRERPSIVEITETNAAPAAS